MHKFGKSKTEALNLIGYSQLILDTCHWLKKTTIAFKLINLLYLDLLGGQEVPVVLELSALGLLVVDEDLVGAVGVQDQGVQVGENVILAPSRGIEEIRDVKQLN